MLDGFKVYKYEIIINVNIINALKDFCISLDII